MTSLSLFFLSLGQADLWLHMDDLEMLYALLWVFKRGLTVTKDVVSRSQTFRLTTEGLE